MIFVTAKTDIGWMVSEDPIFERVSGSRREQWLESAADYSW